MTSKPDQSPAATEVAEISATDPVEQASADESGPNSGQNSVPDSGKGDTGKGDTGEATDTVDTVDIPEQTDDASDAEEPASSETEAGTEEAPAAEQAQAEAAAEGAPAEDAPTEEAPGEEASASDAEASATEGVAKEQSEPEETATEPATSEPTPPAADEAEEDEANGEDAEPESSEPESSPAESSEPESSPAESPEAEAATPLASEPVDTATGLPRRPKPAEAPTEEIRIVAAPTSKVPAVAVEPDEAAEPDAGSTDDDEPATTSTADPSEPGDGTPSAGPAAPPVEESFDFKALSFAAISAAHKKALGPRTVASDAETAEEPEADESADAKEAADVDLDTEAEAEAEPELFAPPADRQAAPPAPPNPFPTQTAPAQFQQGTPSPTVQPQSPFPVSQGGSAQQFPAVHDYAPEASYAGWRPPTSADQAAKRRRYTLIGLVVLGIAVAITVIVIAVSAMGKQQWEPIEAMIAEPKEVHPLQLVLGSCVESIPADGEVSEVLAVPCDTDHTAQVVGRTDFADAAVWPGRDDVDKRVAQVCGTKQLGPTARTSDVTNNVSYVVWSPSEDSWADGDRIGLCLATTAEPITQDLLQ